MTARNVLGVCTFQTYFFVFAINYAGFPARRSLRERFRTNAMPNPDRYRNTLWCGLATWIGVVTMLTWLSYGHAARRTIATSHLQIGGAPRPVPIANSSPDTTGSTAQTASSPDLQRLKAISLDLDAVRQSVDRIGTTQDQITRNIDQLAARQEQITGEMTKLQEGERQILHKNSESPPKSAPALARNPMPRSQVSLMH
jgi:hypothetical protein